MINMETDKIIDDANASLELRNGTGMFISSIRRLVSVIIVAPTRRSSVLRRSRFPFDFVMSSAFKGKRSCPIENENDLRNRIVASCEAIRNMVQSGHFQRFI
ncbi:hypothetical protein ALC57_14186 [Trachymyrmex cornetzi]|uniref:Uncharacterized protein n=1 Tax=Trachymyrmex cornetzi TaxID=471704 RepID=A0A151IYJ7_9HYME|nr:hypothetical protein ALC57_14186 [Trachymyrmex cornetzi]